MQLILDSYGAFLGARDGMFSLRLRGAERRLIPVRDVKGILLMQGVSVSTHAMRLAIENDIPIVLMDKLEHPFGLVWSGQFGSIATIRKHQALWSTDVQGMGWVRTVLARKIRHQQENLLAVGQLVGIDMDDHVDKMAGMGLQFENWRYQGESHSELAGTFRGWEGVASRLYFAALSQLLPAAFKFEKRSKRPAYDPFNALLNYLYGFLYASVELGLMKAGLDPYTGVLHADEYKRPTLVFDTIELYRHWAERVALELCIYGKISPADLTEESAYEGHRLRPSGKRVVVSAMLEYLNAPVQVQDRRRARKVQIDLDAQFLAQTLKTFAPIHRIT
ncbi:MAG TPA: CRISPR-associated endonuclease Cas1 [Saprospiraceae bacterium]|nr:CRISPR-associated endonuclease Cas1 [Saprospiraceae bacterium]